ncbi:hypothetical protein ACLBKS_00115 [Hylemonella sp. W303a]
MSTVAVPVSMVAGSSRGALLAVGVLGLIAAWVIMTRPASDAPKKQV